MMKKMYAIYFMLLSCMCFSACAEQEEVLAENISLSAEVNEVKLGSRTSGYAVPATDEELEALVWLSLESKKYPASLADDASDEMKKLSAETNIPAHRTIKYHSGTASYPDSEGEPDKPRYPVSVNKEVYCIGFYPNDGWKASDGDTKATHVITGYEDLMFAPEIAGSWNQHFGKQKFRHLLAWLKVCVCATTTEAGSYWGNLTKMTLKGVRDSVTISLTEPEPTTLNTVYQLSKIMTPSVAKKNVVMYENTTGIELKIVAQDVASVFCYPQESYVLSIECGNNKTQDIPIALPSLGANDSRAGLQYVLTLYFSPFNVVEGVCTLKEWNAQNEDLYPTFNTGNN